MSNTTSTPGPLPTAPYYPPSGGEIPEPQRSRLIHLAHQWVGQNLNAPDTALFFDDAVAWKPAMGSYTVDGQVEAQSGFGDDIRFNYQVRISVDGIRIEGDMSEKAIPRAGSTPPPLPRWTPPKVAQFFMGFGMGIVVDLLVVIAAAFGIRLTPFFFLGVFALLWIGAFACLRRRWWWAAVAGLVFAAIAGNLLLFLIAES